MLRKRFRTIFSRLMVIQCLTVALAVLLVGAVIMIVMHAERVGEFGTQLNRYAQIAKENKAVEKRIKKAAEEENKKLRALEKAEAKAEKAAQKAAAKNK